MKTLMILITAALAGCGGQYSMVPELNRAQQLAANGAPEDVKFCKYEMEKAPVYGSRTYVDDSLNNLEINERKMRVFNACMDYRRK